MKTKTYILNLQTPLLAAVLLASSLWGRAQEEFRIDWWTVAAGGGTIGDDQFSITGTIGQANAGVLTDGAVALEGGFWIGGVVVAPSQMKTWIGPANGDWYGPTNWSPAGVPGPNDTVIISSARINLSAPVTIGGQLNWSGGTLYGSALTIGWGGTLNISNSVTLGGALINGGTVNWWGGAIYLYGAGDPGPVVNQAGALWNIQCNDNQSLYPYNPYGPNSYFLNQGTVQRSPATWAAHISVRFINTGMVTAQGPLNFEYGGSVGGSFEAATAGAVIAFYGGNFTGAGAVVSGPGLVKLSGGNLLLPTNVIPNLGLLGGTVSLGSEFQGGTITNLTIAGSTLAGTNTLTGTFNWNGGGLSGLLTVAPTGVLNISNSVTLGGALYNAGTVNWRAGAIYLYGAVGDPGPVVNQAGALWNIQCNDNQSLYPYNPYGPNSYFLNQGTVQRSPATWAANISVRFTNTGTLSVWSGLVSFNLANGYTQTGARLDFGLAGPGHPTPVQVSGALGLDGTLSAGLTNYIPQLGDTIPLISCGTLVNTFNYLNLPPAGNNLGWRVLYAGNGVSLQVVSNAVYTAQITGTVTETGGAPVANLTVFAYTTNNSLFLSTTTSGSGSYALNVTNGVWRVGLQGLAARGYAEVPTQDVVVNGANQVANFIVQRLGGVVLACELAGGQLLLHWPATESNWVLEATAALPPASWAPVPQPPVIQGDHWTVTNETPGDARFFRLRK